MQPNDGEISVGCSHCKAAMIYIRSTQFGEKGSMMYRGTCRKPTCTTTADQYVCKWCLDYSNSNNPPGRLGGGRRTGIYRTVRSARQHFSSSTHLVSSPLQQPTNDTFDQSTMMVDGDDHLNDIITNENDPETETVQSIDFINGCGFDKESNSPAFYAYVHANEGKGAQYLAAKAFSVDAADVSMEEARFALLMATLISQLTRAQQELLAEILALASNARETERSVFNSTRVATTVKDFDDLYISGPNSIVCNLPHPVAKCIPDKSHAYVTLTDVIANEMASSTSFDEFFFEANVKLENLTDNPATLSTTTSAYNLFFQ